jgi:hypothetical protein
MTCPICDQKPMNCDCTEAERRMYAEIEELQEQVPQWISVSERLPEIDRDVLLTDGEEVVMAWLAEDGWQTWNASQNWRGARAWMPLPEPPEVK